MEPVYIIFHKHTLGNVVFITLLLLKYHFLLYEENVNFIENGILVRNRHFYENC